MNSNSKQARDAAQGAVFSGGAAEAIDLGKTYETGGAPVHALRHINLEAPAGSFICVLGPSGAGKTTLLNLLGLMDIPTTGGLRVAGQPIMERGKMLLSEGRRDRFRRQHIGFIFTEFFLMPTLTALENVQMPLVWSGTPDEGRAKMLLERVGLGRRLKHRPGELSGGEMQRVAIARALINQPKLLLADEPTGNVDTKTRDGILDLFQELNRDGLTILLATHDQELARRIPQVIRLQGGVLHTWGSGGAHEGDAR